MQFGREGGGLGWGSQVGWGVGRAVEENGWLDGGCAF